MIAHSIDTNPMVALSLFGSSTHLLVILIYGRRGQNITLSCSEHCLSGALMFFGWAVSCWVGPSGGGNHEWHFSTTPSHFLVWKVHQDSPPKKTWSPFDKVPIPTLQQLYLPTKHHPLHPKQTKYEGPQLLNKFTMRQQVVNTLPLTLLKI